MLEHRYVEELVKDIQRNFGQLETQMQGLPASAFNLTKTQSILHDLGISWLDLDSELNTSI